ncbi:MAG: hypothetical protein ACJAS4_001488 [Bacteriovoracaceae bacterium]|jgi:hypothetical protein
MGKKVIFTFISLILLNSCFDRNATDVKYSKNNFTSRETLLARGEAPLNFSSLKKYILKPKCISCHAGEDAKPASDPIDFSTYETTMIDRFAPLFILGKGEKSRLVKSLTHTDLERRMPLDANQLSKLEIEFITNWINACAPKETLEEIPDECSTPPGDDDDDWEDDDDWGDCDDEDDCEDEEF